MSVPFDPSDPDQDPVLVRRERMRKLTTLGQRIGYLCFGVTILVFVYGLVAGFTDGVASAVIAGLVVGSVFLAPSIVFAYAVKAADREDAGQGDGWR